MESKYAAPLDEFLRRGRPNDNVDWQNVLDVAIVPEHIPELIRMATDESLYDIDSDDPRVYAPVHAWRALGQLRAVEAIEPLVGLLWRIDAEHDDWAQEELPIVLAMIGPPALSAVIAYLRDRGRFMYARAAAGRAICEIGVRYPESRAECVAALAGQLERFADEETELNAFLIGVLLDMKASETGPLIQRAFESSAVDEGIVGDWPTVEYELGLSDTPPAPRRLQPIGHFMDERPRFEDFMTSLSAEERAELARRRKLDRKAAASAKKRAKQLKKQKKQQRRR